jgi:hypothetical protein
MIGVISKSFGVGAVFRKPGSWDTTPRAGSRSACPSKRPTTWPTRPGTPWTRLPCRRRGSRLRSTSSVLDGRPLSNLSTWVRLLLTPSSQVVITGHINFLCVLLQCAVKKLAAFIKDETFEEFIMDILLNEWVLSIHWFYLILDPPQSSHQKKTVDVSWKVLVIWMVLYT